jgi:hypothetical protein
MITQCRKYHSKIVFEVCVSIIVSQSPTIQTAKPERNVRTLVFITFAMTLKRVGLIVVCFMTK